MAGTITTIDERSSLALPSEAMGGLGVEGGAELDIKLSAALWSFAPSQKPKRFRRFLDAFESILSRRRILKGDSREWDSLEIGLRLALL